VAEAIAVVTRLRPDRSVPAIALLAHTRFPVRTTRAAYRRAADMAARLNHHLFDTLYHAVALEEGAVLVTADEAYFNKASHLGGIQLLADFKA
jgi:predicted nucleic acid-binding protein